MAQPRIIANKKQRRNFKISDRKSGSRVLHFYFRKFISSTFLAEINVLHYSGYTLRSILVDLSDRWVASPDFSR